MPQSQVSFQNMFTPKIFRYVRTTFGGVGVDNFTIPPAQNPDMFEELTNVMPVTDGGLRKRWGYQLWNSTNLIEAKHAYEYENNTTQLRNILFMVADGTGAASATNNVNAYSEPGVFNLSIFTPSAGAFSPFAVVSRDYAYFSDGIASDLKKWNGGAVTNWGIVPPTSQLNSSGAPIGAVTISVLSGISTAWSASTVFSTLGLLVDPNSNVQELTSVNSSTTNTTQFGISGVGQPNWSQTINTTTTDGTITWTNVGQIQPWEPVTAYANRQPIYDQKSGGVYTNFSGASQTSGSTTPNFSGVSGTITAEFDSSGTPIAKWGCIGNVNSLNAGVNQDIRTWTPNTAFQTYDKSPSGVVEPVAMPPLGSPLPVQPIYLQLNLGAAGTTATTGTAFLTTAIAGQNTTDGDLIWLGLGTANWTNNITVIQWAPESTGTVFTAIKDTNGNMQVCSTGGTTGNTHPTWATGFGQTTAENSPGTAIWTNVGPSLSWAASTKWFLPSSGFAIPSNVQLHGGTAIVDAASHRQFVVASGKSGAIIPSFNDSGSTTPDGTITWQDGGLFTAVTGNITLVGGTTYFTVFRNANTGNISDLSPASITTGPITDDSVLLSNIPVSTDPQVTDVIILRTADGNDQTTLYFVAAVPNGTTTYLDTTSAINLLDNNIYQETDQFGNLIGVANNDVPLPGKFLIAYKGRLYMIFGQTLLFSKSLSDLLTSTGTITGRWEEDWPPGYQLDISNIAETPRGLQTDGQALYIGTERQIHRLLGDGPVNFSQPEVVFNEVGILNQEVWRPVFIENQPVGAMWLTPDNRVVGSDYNSYQDVGQSIQTTLNSINIAAANTSWGMFVSNGQFDLYLLAIPTGINTLPDTICVFDMRSRQWFIWQPTDTVSAGVFNIDVTGLPQWIFTALSGKSYKFVSTTYQDRFNDTPLNYSSTIRTTWQTPFDPSFRQVMNELELMTGDLTTTVTVEGAVSENDFTTPNVLLNNAVITPGLFGEAKVMTVGVPTKYRWYRFTFSSNGTIPNLLEGWNIECIPMGQY